MPTGVRSIVHLESAFAGENPATENALIGIGGWKGLIAHELTDLLGLVWKILVQKLEKERERVREREKEREREREGLLDKTPPNTRTPRTPSNTTFIYS